MYTPTEDPAEDCAEVLDEELPPSPDRDPRRVSGGRYVEGMLWMDDDPDGG